MEEKPKEMEPRLLHERSLFLKSDIDEQTKRLIETFIDQHALRHNIGASFKRLMFFSCRKILVELRKPITKATPKELAEMCDRLRQQKRQGKPISTTTLRLQFTVFFMMLRWLKKNKHISIDVEELQEDVPMPKVEKNEFLSTEALTWTDIEKLARVAKNTRDKAILAVLLDCGGRINEVLAAKIGDLTFQHDNQVALLKLNRTKTKEKTEVQLIDSVPSLLRYLAEHPGRTNPGSWLWLNTNRGGFTKTRWRDGSVRAMLTRLAREAGFEKRFNPHFFRKSSASMSDLPDGLAKKKFGWTQASMMLNVYRNPDLIRANNEELVKRGIMEDGPGGKKENVKRCRWCEAINAVDAVDCHVCLRPLNVKTSIREEDITKKWLDAFAVYMKRHPEMQGELVKLHDEAGGKTPA